MTTQPEALRLADALLEPVVLDKHAMQAAAELRRLHSENKTLRATLSTPRHGEWDRLLELKAEVERERESRQAAQIESDDLKARIARSGVELQRAVLAEREACARVCDERAMKNEHACEGLDDEDATGLRSAAWQMSVCAAAIRARGAAPQQPEGEPT